MGAGNIEIYEVVSPVGEPGQEMRAPAARLADLSGKTICEVWNGLYQADKVLGAAGAELKRRHPGVNVIPWTDLPAISIFGDISHNLKELREALRHKRCDAVIAASGG